LKFWSSQTYCIPNLSGSTDNRDEPILENRENKDEEILEEQSSESRSNDEPCSSRNSLEENDNAEREVRVAKSRKRDLVNEEVSSTKKKMRSKIV